MNPLVTHGRMRVFSTCPPSNLVKEDYLGTVREIARWSERAGCEGVLVYTDNGLLDPWIVSQVIIEATERLCPLVAVQPIYMHPYTVAKMVATFGSLYHRRLWLNLVAGGFKTDLLALEDDTPHDRRYDRLFEYTTVVRSLLETPEPVTFQGAFYRVTNLKLTPALDRDLMPGLTVSGSSDAGLAAARRLGAVAVQYPRPPQDYLQNERDQPFERGIRIGIIGRERGDEAWRVARQRFPEDRRGQVTHQLAMKVSDSQWHRQLSELGKQPAVDDNPYWLVPFENYKTFCPYLVGAYDRVALEVARYRNLGYETIILDVPTSPEELEHIGVVFERAAALAQA